MSLARLVCGGISRLIACKQPLDVSTDLFLIQVNALKRCKITFHSSLCGQDPIIVVRNCQGTSGHRALCKSPYWSSKYWGNRRWTGCRLASNRMNPALLSTQHVGANIFSYPRRVESPDMLIWSALSGTRLSRRSSSPLSNMQSLGACLIVPMLYDDGYFPLYYVILSADFEEQ